MMNNNAAKDRHNRMEFQNILPQCDKSKFVCKIREEQRTEFNEDYMNISAVFFNGTSGFNKENGPNNNNLKYFIKMVVMPTSLHNHSPYFGNHKYMKAQLILALCIVFHFFGWASCAAITGQRMPPFLDVEAAVESSKCTVREEVVNIRTVHPTLPSDAVLSPSCVVLRKCSGCCQSDKLECVPTISYQSSVEVSIQLTSPPSYDLMKLNFTHHEACECHRNDGHRCVARPCRATQVWDQSTCDCQPRCIPEVCPNMMHWNPRRCRCECPQCHPNRLFHVRFNQNSQTCMCTCRVNKSTIQMCRRKKAIFNKSTCGCQIMHRRGSNRPY